MHNIFGRSQPFGRCPADAVMTQDFQRVDAMLRSTNQRQFPKPRKEADDMAASWAAKWNSLLFNRVDSGTWVTLHFKPQAAEGDPKMIYLILLSACSGAIVTLLLQLLLLYRRSPEPIARTVQYVKAVPDPALKDYFSNQQAESTQQQSDITSSASKQPEAASPKQQETTVPGSSPKQQPSSPSPSLSDPQHTSKEETCDFLNAIFLFLFRELRDTPVVRHWITKKIKVEFEELLLTKTAGRLLEGLSLRDFSLGNSVPVFKTARLMKPVALNEDNMPEELNFEVDLEYNGGFHLAIDVDLVFGKSAYLFVKMTRVAGRLKLQFTRMPFTHWSFSFLEDPLIDFEVKSQFEGRPLPQLTSIIVNQLKRVIKKKHTLPNYKIR